MSTWRIRRAAIAVFALTLLVAGCGDDDDNGEDAAATGGTAADDQASAANVEEYCAASAALDEQEGAPTPEQLEELRSISPDEIETEIDFVAGKIIAAIEAGDISQAFTDDEVNEAFEAIEAFEEENCPQAEGDENEDAGDDESTQQIDPDATRVDVVASEYAFEFAAPAAGRTSFVMRNEGQESHFMLIARFKEGVTFDQAFEAVRAGGDPEEFVEVQYESETATPGQEAPLTIDLEAGEYGMLCFIPGPDGEPHAFKGMAAGFTVS